jgi:hypothetical protein
LESGQLYLPKKQHLLLQSSWWYWWKSEKFVNIPGLKLKRELLAQLIVGWNVTIGQIKRDD